MARDFNGTTDHLDSGGTPNLVDGATAMSASCMVNLDVALQEQKPISQWGGPANCFLLFITADGRVGFALSEAGTGDSLVVTGTTVLSTGTWYNIGFSWTQPSTYTIYLDGVAETPIVLVDQGVTSIRATAQSVKIGIADDGEPVDGRLAEIGIWNRALTAAEFAALGKRLSPLWFRQGMRFYCNVLGRYSPEKDLIAGLSMTVNGTTQAEHPRTFFPPTTKRFRSVAPVAAGNPLFMMSRAS